MTTEKTPSLREAALLAILAIRSDDTILLLQATAKLTAALAVPDEPAAPKPLKLYGWQVAGTRDLHTGDFAETNAKAEAKHIGGHAFPLYTAPQPDHAEAAPDMVRQPLTEKQKREIWVSANTRHMTAMQLFLEGFDAAELAHGIKAAA